MFLQVKGLLFNQRYLFEIASLGILEDIGNQGVVGAGCG